MVYVKNNKALGFRPSVNATFGEDGRMATKSFVPALSRLGRLGATDWYPANFVEAPKEEVFYPTNFVEITPTEQTQVDAHGTWLPPTTTLLIAGSALLGVGLIAYLIARS